MITYENAESALQFLVNTDDEYARAKTLYDALHEQRKTVEAIEYNLLKTGSAADKKQLAIGSNEYSKHLIALYDSHIEYETLKAKRLTNQSIIEMWRSVNSARKQGNI